MAVLAPIFATIYDTEKPLYVTLERDLQADETLRLYVFDDSDNRIPYFDAPEDVFHWNELFRGTEPWPVIPAGTEITLFLECDELYAATGITGPFFLNIAIWDEDNADQETVASHVLVLQPLLYPGQNE